MKRETIRSFSKIFPAAGARLSATIDGNYLEAEAFGMIPHGGYVISYCRRDFNEIRRTSDGRPKYEFPALFLVRTPERKKLVLSLGVRLTVEAFADELPKFCKEWDQATFEEAILRWAVRRIEDGLRDGSIEPSSEWLMLEAENFVLLWDLANEKRCEYQVREGRDLFCSAADAARGGTTVQLGVRTLAPVSRMGCSNCALPDADYLCSNLTHPKIRTSPPGPGGPGIIEADCNLGKFEIEAPSLCHAAGHSCWERRVEPREEDRPPDYTSPTLTRALDLLDTVWRLRFGRRQGLVNLPSSTSIASLERDCITEQEFHDRIISLADVLGAFSIPDNLIDAPVDGSLNRLASIVGKHIAEESDRNSASSSVSILRSAVKLRRAAAHGGSGARTEGLQAVQELNIRYYPQASWKSVWDQVRERVVEALDLIMTAMRKEALRS